MKLFILLFVTLVALCGVALATKDQDYQAYKNAEKAADAKSAQCSRYNHGNCATIAECDACATCLAEVTSLYKTAIAMRRAYTKKWFNGWINSRLAIHGDESGQHRSHDVVVLTPGVYSLDKTATNYEAKKAELDFTLSILVVATTRCPLN
ncbi:hypothetical protein GQ42DRAFT_153036 [Ramicandelaber brevisporus]|nr:hypothetical protein GQ42DRAFT_153036 [Ramicandelaber brevisporus]